MYLARIDPTVFPYSQVAYINCAMGPHIIPAGWLLNNATTAPNVQFWEYKSTNLNGSALDVSQRASFSRQLTAAEASQWSNPAFVLSGWVPSTLSSPVALAKAGEAVKVQWTAPLERSGSAWVGLFNSGSPDSAVLAAQTIGEGAIGEVTFYTPLQPGQYELRLFLNLEQKQAAVGHRIRVQ